MKQETLQLTGGNHKNDRRELDFYPTPPEVTHALMKFINLPPSLIWEPACGTGAMSEVIKQYGHIVSSTDIIDPCEYGAGGIDFTSPLIPVCFTTERPAAIITNPPFNESEQFIRQALKYSDIVCMLLKSQYWHARKRLTLFNQHPPAWVLPLTWRPDFLAGAKGGAPTMEMIWTVWMKGDTLTKYKPLSKP